MGLLEDWLVPGTFNFLRIGIIVNLIASCPASDVQTKGTIISCTDLEGKLTLGKNNRMLHQIIQNKDTIFFQSINGIKTLTILYKTKILSNDLVYGACIPLEDICTFKKLEGISPSEYREMKDNNSSFSH